MPAGDQSLSGAPTFDDEAASRLSLATDATKARARTFGLSPVSNVTAKAGGADIFRLPDGQVPGKFFHPGPAGFEHMQAALTASPEALPILQDHAALTLRRAAMRDDGTIDPAKFARWQASHRDALRALPPETQARFADASAAGEAVAEAGAGRAEAMKTAQKGALQSVADAVAARNATMSAAQRAPTGRVAVLTEPQDVTRTVGSILGGRTAVADMKALGSAARRDPNARLGLRQAVADHITTKYLGNTEVAASGQTQIKGDGFQTFIRQNKPALEAANFSPAEIASMEAIAADIQRAKRSETAVKLPGGSNTAQDVLAASKGKPTKGVRTVIDLLVGGVGFAHGGPIGSLVGALGADLIQGLRTGGIERVDQLVTEALLNPQVAAALLEKLPTGPTPKVPARSGAKLLKALKIAGATSSAKGPDMGLWAPVPAR